MLANGGGRPDEGNSTRVILKLTGAGVGAVAWIGTSAFSELV